MSTSGGNYTALHRHASTSICIIWHILPFLASIKVTSKNLSELFNSRKGLGLIHYFANHHMQLINNRKCSVDQFI